MDFTDRKLFFIDAETDGLYGSVISVGIIVTDANCKELERFYFGIHPQKLKITDPWVRENVVPILGKYENCQNEEELLCKVWECWTKYSMDAYAIGDVIYPVETGLFEKCVKFNLNERKFKAPFPLLDISNMLFAKGVDPLTEREALLERKPEGTKHNALYDIEVNIQLFKKYIWGEEG